MCMRRGTLSIMAEDGHLEEKKIVELSYFCFLCAQKVFS